MSQTIISSKTYQSYIITGNELNKFIQLLNCACWHRLDMLLPFFSLTWEFWQELFRNFVTDKHDSSVVQALQWSVQATWCCAKINNNIDETLTSVMSTLDELFLIKIFTPLDDVYSKIKTKSLLIKFLDVSNGSTHLSNSCFASSNPSSRKLATVNSILFCDSLV